MAFIGSTFLFARSVVEKIASSVALPGPIRRKVEIAILASGNGDQLLA